MSDTVLYETRGPSAWLTLNRPEKLNAINHDLRDTLVRLLDRAVADDDVRVVVIRGAGRAFSAGFDLSEEAAGAIDNVIDWQRELATDVAMTMKVYDLPKPTIAAVHGWCLAGAMELAMAADLLVASTDARFGEPEIRYGSGPVTLLMPYVLGQRATRELLLTGDTIDAVEAHRLGAVNAVVAPDELEATVARYVAKIAPTPLDTLRLTKLALNRAYEAMGLRAAVQSNLDISVTINAAQTPEQEEFDRIVRTDGLKAALAWRDARYGEVLGQLGIEEGG